MALPLADALSTPPPLQDVLLFNYKQYVIAVPEEFSDEWKILLRLQEKKIDSGAVYSVASPTRVYTFAGTLGAKRRICIQVNLPPTAREELNQESIGYPICLVELDGMVVAGVFWCLIEACPQIEMDKRFIDLSYARQSYTAFSKRFHQLTYRRLRPATPTTNVTAAAPHSQTGLTRTKRRSSFESTQHPTLLLPGPQLKRQCTEPKSTTLAIELEQTHDALVQEELHQTVS